MPGVVQGPAAAVRWPGVACIEEYRLCKSLQRGLAANEKLGAQPTAVKQQHVPRGHSVQPEEPLQSSPGGTQVLLPSQLPPEQGAPAAAGG